MNTKGPFSAFKIYLKTENYPFFFINWYHI